MSAFYKICALMRGQGIEFSSGGIRIDLDRIKSTVCDDVAFHASRADGVFFWVSGGGSVVIQNRFVPLVQRPRTAFVNPGKYSLFSGRANGFREWIKPHLLVRELFEELLLFQSGRPVRPSVSELGEVVESAWQSAMPDVGFDLDTEPQNLPFTPISLPNRQVVIAAQGKTHTHLLPYHISAGGDINILFAYSVDIDPDLLTAQDGEHSGERHLRTRRVVLYDRLKRTARPISEAGDEMAVIGSDMTEHLLAFLENLEHAPGSSKCG